MSIHESGVGVNQLCQIIEPAAEECQHCRRVEPGLATVLEKDVDAGAQPFQGTSVTCDEVVETRARIWMAAYLVPMVTTVRICAVIEKPFQSSRIHRLARSKDDGEMSVPQGVHIRAVRDQKLHHWNAICVERGSHQRSVAPLVHIRSMGD